jgi:hypothetical protein
MNVTFLANHDRWELGRLRPFLLVAKWIHAPITEQPIQLPREHPARRTQTPAVASIAAPLPAAAAVDRKSVDANVARLNASAPVESAKPPVANANVYFSEFSRSIGFVFIGFLILGLATCGRQFRNPDKGILAALTIAALLAVWIRLTQIGNMNGRYFFIVVLIDSAFAAMGCLAATRWIGQMARQWFGTRFHARLAQATIFGGILVAGWIQAFAHQHVHRDLEVQLGRLIRQQAGPVQSVACDEYSMRTAYVAAGAMPQVVTYDDFLDPQNSATTPDLLIFSRSPSRALSPIVHRAAELGMEPLDLPASSQSGFVIFVRKVASVAAFEGPSVDATLTSLP